MAAAIPPLVHEGETVLDLGSGGGKIYHRGASRRTRGRVIGVDLNDEMLDLARAAEPRVAENIGFANVEFRKRSRTFASTATPPMPGSQVHPSRTRPAWWPLRPKPNALDETHRWLPMA